MHQLSDRSQRMGMFREVAKGLDTMTRWFIETLVCIAPPACFRIVGGASHSDSVSE